MVPHPTLLYNIYYSLTVTVCLLLLLDLALIPRIHKCLTEKSSPKRKESDNEESEEGVS